MEVPKEKRVLSQALELLQEYPLCDRCLGRLFGWLGTDTTNPERGRSIKLLLIMDADLEIRSGDKGQGKEDDPA